MNHTRQAPGGGRVVEVSAERLPGWLTRFGGQHGGLASIGATLSEVTVTGGDGATAEIAVPFPPMRAVPGGHGEPVEALLAHIAGLGDLAAIAVRERSYSVGACRGGVVTRSSTDTRYVQSRTAAGGWSQQRYARRRGNQRRDSYRAAADTAHRVLTESGSAFDGLIVAGDRGAIEVVLEDPRLAAIAVLPRRTFLDVAEPRRAVLDELAVRALGATITVRDSPRDSQDADATSGR